MARLFPTLFAALCLSTAAQADPPRCGDPELVGSFQKQALDAITGYVDLMFSVQRKVLTTPFDVKLTRMYQLAMTDAERSCSGVLVISEGGKSAELQVEYSMIATEDGQTLFKWSQPRGWIDSLFVWLPTPQGRDMTDSERAPLGMNAADMVRKWNDDHPDRNKPADIPHSETNMYGGRQ